MTTPNLPAKLRIPRRISFSFVASVRAARVLVSVAVCLTFACGSVVDERNEMVLAELRSQERVWMDAAVKNYSMVIVRRCTGCELQVPGPVRVEVNNGVVTAQILTTTDGPVPEFARPLVPHMEGLFAELKRNMGSNWRSLEVAYDAILGYPTRVRIDFDLTTAAVDLSIDVTEFVRR